MYASRVLACSSDTTELLLLLFTVHGLTDLDRGTLRYDLADHRLLSEIIHRCDFKKDEGLVRV